MLDGLTVLYSIAIQTYEQHHLLFAIGNGIQQYYTVYVPQPFRKLWLMSTLSSVSFLSFVVTVSANMVIRILYVMIDTL